MRLTLFLTLSVFVQFACTSDLRSANQEEPISITATDLAEEYSENEVSADKRYLNRLVRVSGKVSEVANVNGSLQIALEGKGYLKVQCSFMGDSKGLIKRNSQTAFKGVVQGKNANIYIELDKCELDN